MEKLFYATIGANVAAAERMREMYKEIFTDFGATYETWAEKGADFLSQNNFVPEQLREQWKANSGRAREQWEEAVRGFMPDTSRPTKRSRTASATEKAA